MNGTTSTPGGPQHATFHARVAGVGLITTVVVLVLACLTFMLQQWGVALAESKQVHRSLAEITAQTVGPAVAAGDRAEAALPLKALAADKTVISARLKDNTGATLATYARAGAGSGKAAAEIITADVNQDGRRIGRLTMSVEAPALGPMLPKFIALTGDQRAAARAYVGQRFNRRAAVPEAI